jgi:hypothetical protein
MAPRAALAARFEPVAGAVVRSGRIATAVEPGTALEIGTPHGTGRAPFPVDGLDVTDPDDGTPSR